MNLRLFRVSLKKIQNRREQLRNLSDLIEDIIVFLPLLGALHELVELLLQGLPPHLANKCLISG
jgi:hypothetical protein